MQYKKGSIVSLVDMLVWRASATPDRTAYTFLVDGEDKEEVVTYKTLDQRARSIAAYLQSLNLDGERALLLFPSGIQYITAFLGCLYAGVIAIPAYPPRKNRLGERIDAILSDADARVVLTTKKIFSDLNRKFENQQYLRALTFIEVDNIDYSNYASWKKPDLNSGTLAFLQYTSGSTGSPKGVMVSHGNLMANGEYIRQSYSLTEESVSVFWLPIFHDLGLINGVLQPLYTGFHGVVMAPTSFLEKPFRWLMAITKYRGTHGGAPNFAFDLCVNKVTDDQLRHLDLSCWESAFNGAEPVRYATWKNFSQKFAVCGFRSHQHMPVYGLAEGTLLVTAGELNKDPVFCKVDSHALKNNIVIEASHDAEGTFLMSSGKTILDTKVVIVDPDTLEACDAGKIGEVWISGSSVAKGYWRKDQATKETFHAYIKSSNEGPFLRTGDLGFSKDELFYITGRLKDVIIIRGQNYYPQDIELTVEEAHPALRTAGGAAFSLEVNGEERLVVIHEIERVALRDLNVNEVCDCISKAISQHHELKVYAIALINPGSLPKTSSGKTQRKASKKSFSDGTLSVVGAWHEPRSSNKSQQVEASAFESFAKSSQASIQKWLIYKVAECFNVSVDTVSIDDAIDRLGMDSMIAVQLSGDIGKWLSMDISQTILYDYPTIKSLAAYLFNEVSSRTSLYSFTEDQVGANESIAIVGLGCRFPGALNVEEYVHLLEEGKNSVVEMPNDRWNLDQLSSLSSEEIKGIKWAGLLKDIDQFDPQFFGISPLEAINIDPQQRLLLEVSWEALENAGIASSQIAGQNVGVFIGVSTNEYGELASQNVSRLNAYSGTGSAFSIAANRLSYIYDLRGPSIAIDTACSSSLVAIHQACESLMRAESTIAIAGGVNLLLTPKWSIVFSRAQMLAKDGKCKTFDASADGYVRGEGCGIVILKRLSDALKNGDTIHAVIKGSAINQDGRSNGLTAPNGPSQEAVIQKALSVAKVLPSEIGYVETHGSGTPLGDPIEINALKKVLMQKRDPNSACYIGSVKTNIGHLEAAAGIAGFIKTVLSLKKKMIFPHLNFSSLNTQIRIEGTPIKITSQALSWQSSKRLAGVSSFGFGGTNAHIVLEEAPAISNHPSIDRPVHIFTLSAKTGQALKVLCDKYISFLNSNKNYQLKDICYSAANGRNHFAHRVGVITDSIDELKEKLEAFKLKKTSTNLFHNQVKGHADQEIAFLFTGQGSQYKGMAKELYETQQVFKDTFDQCDQILRKYIRISIAEALYSISENVNPEFNVDKTQYTQPLLFTIEYSLAVLLKSWGVEPAVVIGHSVGEYVAACIAGVFSLEDGLKLIAERAKLMQHLPENDGEMIATTATAPVIEKIIHPYKRDVSVAAINGPDQIVISGAKKAMQEIVKQLDSEGIKWVKLQVSHAFHSPLMKPIVDSFTKVAQSITYKEPAIKLISNVSGDFVNEAICTPEYWINHILAPVRFFQSVNKLYENKYPIFIEVGPKPTLLSIIKSYKSEDEALMLPTLSARESNWQTLSKSLVSLYMQNISIQWGKVYKNCGQRISLPSYPFLRSRYWIEEGAPGNDTFGRQRSASQKKISKSHSLLGFLMQEDFTVNNFAWERRLESLPVENKHEGKLYIPFTTYVEMASAAVKEAFGDRNIQLKDLRVHHPFLNNHDGSSLKTILCQNKNGQLSFQVSTIASNDSVIYNETLCASATVDFPVYPAFTTSLN